jgi:signal transduction histidine kinase
VVVDDRPVLRLADGAGGGAAPVARRRPARPHLQVAAAPPTGPVADEPVAERALADVPVPDVHGADDPEAEGTGAGGGDEAVALGAASGGRPVAEQHLLDLLVHELRLPLTIISGRAEELDSMVDAPDPGRARSMIDDIQRQVQAIDGMLRTLVDARALGGGPLPLFREDVDLGALVDEVVRDLAATTTGREIAFSAGATGPVLAAVDRARIAQVLANLIGNADKFSPPGTPVVVRLGRHGAAVELHVLDDGPGIPSGRASDVFGKFTRLDRTVPGTGLGLYIARGISRAHGGELEWRPRPGGGSDFVLRVPVNGCG